MDAVTIIAMIISVVVPAFAIYLIYLLDLFGTGKGNTVGICMAWGAIGSFGLAYLANTFIMRTFDLEFETVSRFVAPVVEELLKAVILVYFIQQPRFRYFVDGAIYGYAAGIGFAMSENIFYVLNDSSGEALGLAVSRVLTASLMHAAAGAVVGIAFGLSRRRSGIQKYVSYFFGIGFAIIVHAIYNNIAFELEQGVVLIIVAMGIGIGGGVVIGTFMNIGLSQEKKRFAETLSGDSGISGGERRAIQQLGSEGIETLLEDMSERFGEEKADLIRQLFVIQANIGILKNNLKTKVGERLRKAWEQEIADLKTQMDEIRSKLGTYIMTLLRSLLPEDEESTETLAAFRTEMTKFDPTHVHSFDMFVMASELAGTISPEQIEQISNRLHDMSIFNNVDYADLDNLSRAVAIRQYSHGEYLFRQGDEGDAMYLIDQGYIDITLDGPNGESVLRTYQSGEVVGELSLLDGQPRSAGARANGSLQVMILRREHFDMFIKSRPKVILAVLKFLADRVRYTTTAVTSDIQQQNTVGQTAEQDEKRFDIAPTYTDSVSEATSPIAGVFGRLAAVLDSLEQDADKN